MIRTKLKRSNHRNPCPVCGGEGCGQGEAFTLCWRITSDRIAKSGAYLHFNEAAAPNRHRSFTRPVPVIAPVERRHQIYTELLDRVPLYACHADHLTGRRRLSDTTIALEQFASVPSKALAGAVVRQLGKEFDLSHVPGFFFKGDRWHLRFAGMAGFFIPIRDHRGRIQALQIRRDTDESKHRYLMLSSHGDEFPKGASSGAPAHYARPNRADVTIITEGALKADCIAEVLDCCVIGFEAVGTFNDRIGWQIREALPNLRRLLVAYDADWRSNDKVRNQMHRLYTALTGAGYAPECLNWPIEQGKGLDDYLLAGGEI